MKKTIYIAVLSLIIGLAATSCKKDETKAKFSPVGFWKGKWSNSSSPTPTPNNEFLWLTFKEDGTIRVCYDDTDTTGSNKASGTYTVSDDNTVSWIVPDFDESSVANVRENETKLVGSWGQTPSNNNQGLLEVTKQ